jgi:autotransporter translocation and assembly factor TamB
MAETHTQPYKPFQPQQTPFLPESIVEDLEENIWKMGNMSKPKDYTDGPTPVRVEELYDVQERHALTTNKTTPVYWDLQTNEPKKIILQADGADHYVDFNQQITTDSQKIFSNTSLTIKTRGTIRIWAKTVSADTGTLRILVFKL